MNIEEIHAEWNIDSQIDNTQLDLESLKISTLHNKYLKFLSKEKLLLKKAESEFKVLYLEKYEFYTNGPTKEQNDKGWQLPAKGMILKSEVKPYMDADADLINFSLKIELQREKVEILTAIIDSLNRRSFNIKNAVEWMKFTNGNN